MASENWTAIARVLSTHGLKGEVSVVSASGASLSVFVGKNVWLVPPPEHHRSGLITQVRDVAAGKTLLTIDTLRDLDSAHSAVGTSVLVRSCDVPQSWIPPEEDPDNMLGFMVIDTEKGALGTIDETIVTGANDVWVVQGDYGQVLIPVIDDVVVSIDRETHTVRIDLLPGLLEDE